MMASSGTLYLVSTPIGNLGDFPPRALEILRSVKYVLCESVFHTKKLFSLSILPAGNSSISGILCKKYESKGFKGDQQISRVIFDLENGNHVALVSNAGTPLISDPGLKLVKAVIGAKLPVVNIPGPTAFISAVITSGLPTKSLIFIGFLPKKETAIKKSLVRGKSALIALEEPASLVCYVSKYQLSRTIDCLKEVFSDSQITVSLARELTKLHEAHFTGSITDLNSWLSQNHNRKKGEFTLCLSISS